MAMWGNGGRSGTLSSARPGSATDGEGNPDMYRPPTTTKRWAALGAATITGLLAGMIPASAAPSVTTQAVNTTVRVTVSTSGAQANGRSWAPSITNDGRYVVFLSDATNLVSGDTNGVTDVFVRDLGTGTTQRVNVSSSGAQANGAATNAMIARGGRYVVFDSKASNLVAGDTNGGSDVFVRDLQTNTTERVSMTPQEGQVAGNAYAGTISDDGSGIAFEMASPTNLRPLDVFYRDRVRKYTERIPSQTDGLVRGPNDPPEVPINTDPVIAPNGWRVSYRPSDGVATGIAVYRRSVNTYSVAPISDGGNGRTEHYVAGLSFDGRFTVVRGGGQEISVYDQSNNTVKVPRLPDTPGDRRTIAHGVTADGYRVLYSAELTATRGTYLVDVRNNSNRLVSLPATGSALNAPVDGTAAVTGSGSHVVFGTAATNAVAGDTNGKVDLFVRRLA